MMALLLRFEAPILSFGAPMVDHRGVIATFPALSMLTGLIANALGWSHKDFHLLTGLQDRLRFAARIDRCGELIQDYQTVDLGQDFMDPKLTGWTSRGSISKRGGAKANNEGTHIRHRDYWADSVYTIALTLVADGAPSLDQVAKALIEPARPLYLGRKCCLPTSQIFIAMRESSSLLSALTSEPLSPRADEDSFIRAWWEEGDDSSVAVGDSRIVPVTDEREWNNQVHTGRRFMREGNIHPPRHN